MSKVLLKEAEEMNRTKLTAIARGAETSQLLTQEIVFFFIGFAKINWSNCVNLCTLLNPKM